MASPSELSPLSLPSSEHPASPEERDSLERSTKKVKENENNPSTKTFRDTLIEGKSTTPPQIISMEEIEAANQVVEMVDDNEDPSFPKIPKVRFTKEIMQKLCTPWQNALIIKLLGKSINYRTLTQRLQQEWKTEAEFELIDVDLGYYIAKFTNNRDCAKILTGGPYKIYGHYLAVQLWKPNFRSCQAKAPTTAVWIHFPRLSMDYYHESILLFLGNKVGKSLRVDKTTLMAGVGRFARVCVEIDLSKPLVPMIDFESVEPDGAVTTGILPVVYEGLHVICFGCGEYGHRKENCSYLAAATTQTTNQTLATAKLQAATQPTAEPLAATQSPTTVVQPATAQTPRMEPQRLVRKSTNLNIPQGGEIYGK